MPENHFFGQNLSFKVRVSGQNTFFYMFFTKSIFFCENIERTVQYKGRSGIARFKKSAFCITRVILGDNFHYYFELQTPHIGGDLECSKMCKNMFSMQYCLERNSQKCTKSSFFASFLNKRTSSRSLATKIQFLTLLKNIQKPIIHCQSESKCMNLSGFT